MKIHEYQAKKILRKFGIPVPAGEVAFSPREAAEAASRLGGECVLKAQIHAGGRGAAGGVKRVRSAEEAEARAKEILGKVLVTRQTGPAGRRVRRLLVEAAVDVAREMYLGILVDRSAARPVVLASAEGGVEIETVAAETPDKVFRESVDPRLGLMPFQARKLAFRLGMRGDSARSFGQILADLYRAFRETDAALVEINPLAITKEGRLLALDAKVAIDDNGLYRHPDLRELRDLDEEDPLEVEASKHGLNYVRLDGEIGCMVNGAGLAMATMDIIKAEGGRPANFLDVGGGASSEQVAHGFRILRSDPRVRSILINIFGGIVRCDRVAAGVVEAASGAEMQVPIVVRLEGTNAAEGRRILEESGLRFAVARGMEDAARQAVRLAGAAETEGTSRGERR